MTMCSWEELAGGHCWEGTGGHSQGILQLRSHCFHWFRVSTFYGRSSCCCRLIVIVFLLVKQ